MYYSNYNEVLKAVNGDEKKANREYLETALEKVSEFLEYWVCDECDSELNIYCREFDPYIEDEIIELSKDIENGKFEDLTADEIIEKVEEYQHINEFTDLIYTNGFTFYEWYNFIEEVILFDSSEACKLYDNYIQGNKEIEYKIIYDYLKYEPNYYIDKKNELVYCVNY